MTKDRAYKLPEIQLSEYPQIVPFSFCFTTTSRETAEYDPPCHHYQASSLIPN